MPACLAARPRDRRGLPIPVVTAIAPDGTPDFTANSGPETLRVGEAHECGLCGQPLDYWIAFLGGPMSASTRAFTDPPMHEECAQAALKLCPHIARRGTSRAKKHRAEDVITPDGFTDGKVSEWVLYVTRSYDTLLLRDSVVFRPAPAKRLRRFTYNDEGELYERE